MRLKTVVKISKDDRIWKSMRRNLLRSVDNTVDVGWWGGKNQPRTKIPSAQVAKWNEEGHANGGIGGNTPPRPFIRTLFLPEAAKLLENRFAPLVKDIAKGIVNWTFLKELMKEDLKGSLQKAILDWDSPKNSPVTISKKGFDDPLIETGTMYDSVKSRVSRRGGV